MFFIEYTLAPKPLPPTTTLQSTPSTTWKPTSSAAQTTKIYLANTAQGQVQTQTPTGEWVLSFLFLQSKLILATSSPDND